MSVDAATAVRRPYPAIDRLPTAVRVFLAEESPRNLLLTVFVLLVARLTVRGGSWVDLAVAGGLVAFQPFSEWLIHVHILHVVPRGPLTRALDAAAGRSHRQHHADPRDLGHVFIHRYVTRADLVLAVVLGALVVPRVPAIGTGTLVATALTLLYEWTHFLIHADLEPRTRLFRAVRRNHRLHHFRNENYWFGVVSPISDLVLRTAPEKFAVPVSPTAATARAGQGG